MHRQTPTRLSTGRLYVGIAARRSHVARHAVTLRRSPLRALSSLARQAGDFVWGCFLALDA
jgi:hypothetical protein